MQTRADCVFCDQSKLPADTKRVFCNDLPVLIFTPLNPVTPGHTLVVPEKHVELDVFNAVDPHVMAAYGVASKFMSRLNDANLITSKGKHATQTIAHMHLHIVPRREDDGLFLPWTWQKIMQDAVDSVTLHVNATLEAAKAK